MNKLTKTQKKCTHKQTKLVTKKHAKKSHTNLKLYEHALIHL